MYTYVAIYISWYNFVAIIHMTLAKQCLTALVMATMFGDCSTASRPSRHYKGSHDTPCYLGNTYLIMNSRVLYFPPMLSYVLQ